MSKLTREERAQRAKKFFPDAYADSNDLRSLIEGTIDPIYDMLPKNHRLDRAWIGNNPHLTIDYSTVRDITMPLKSEGERKVLSDVMKIFNGLQFNGSCMIAPNVYPQPNRVTYFSSIFSNVFCPNILDGESAWNTQRAELEASSMLADLFGWTPTKAGCIFTYGGEGGWEYAIKYALTRVLKNSRYTGIREDAKVICSQQAQFSKLCSVDWNGLGLDNLIQIPTNDANEMDLDKLENVLKDLHEKEIPVAAIVCTEGTTDANAFDDILGVKNLLDRFPNPAKYGKTLIYADAVVGFAWTAFNKYDYETNPLGFATKTLMSIKKLADRVARIKYADCAAADFHKSGYCPYAATAFCYQNRAEFESLMTRVHNGGNGDEEATYAYLQNRSPYNPMDYTLESSRSAQGSICSWATLKYFGAEGFQLINGVQLERHELLRGKIAESVNMVCVNPKNAGDVTLFRIYGKGVYNPTTEYEKELSDPKYLPTLKQHNEFIRKVGDTLWDWYKTGKIVQGRYTPYITYTTGFRKTAYNEDGSDKDAVIFALKIYPLNINVTDEDMDWILQIVKLAAKYVISEEEKAAQ